MINRSSSSTVLRALALAFIASPLLTLAQAPAAPADASSTNAPAAAPAPAPAPATTTAPAAPADTTATTTTTPAERPSTYTVAQGDSLWKIAHQFGTTVVKLRKANNLKKGALLHPGQVLQIPPAATETK